jgi:hypothetical protein
LAWILGWPVVWLTTVLTNLSKNCWIQMVAVWTLPSYPMSKRGSSTARAPSLSCCTPISKPSDFLTAIIFTSNVPSSSARGNASWYGHHPLPISLSIPSLHKSSFRIMVFPQIHKESRPHETVHCTHISDYNNWVGPCTCLNVFPFSFFALLKWLVAFRIQRHKRKV